MGLMLGVLSGAGQGLDVQMAAVSLVSPPRDLSLLNPSRLPLIAEVSGLESGNVSVEFFDGDHSLGLVDSPFSVLPGLVSEEDLGPSGIYVFDWEEVPSGIFQLSAALWVDGVLVDRSSSSRIELVAVDEQAEVNVRVLHPIASEGGDLSSRSAVFELQRSGSLESSFEVFFSWDGDAVYGEDFRAPRDSVTFLAGESTALVEIESIDDRLVENDETAILRLQSPVCLDVFPPLPSCYLLGSGSEGMVTLRDNDSERANEVPFVILLEPLSGQAYRSGDSVAMLAHAWDLDGRVESVEFFAGNRSLGRTAVEGGKPEPIDPTGVPVPPAPSVVDFTWEDVPVGRFTLRARAVDSSGGVSDSPGVSINVIGDELPPLVTIEARDSEATEGQSRNPGRPSPVDSGTFVVRRTGNLQRALVVSLDIGGTARNGLDYSLLREQVTIPSGQDLVVIEVTPRDDRIVEGAETVLVAIQSSDCGETSGRGNRCYVVGRNARARVIIEDDERTNQTFAPSVSLVRPSAGAVIKDTQAVSFVAEAEDRNGRVVSVEFFVNGERVGLVRARGNGRGVNRFFQLNHGRMQPGRFEVSALATDDDGETSQSEPVSFVVELDLVRPIISVRTLDPIAAEVDSRGVVGSDPVQSAERRRQMNTATFQVTRTGLRDVALSIPYRLSGSAVNGEDYQGLSGTLELASGETRAQLVVVPIDDRESEGQEDVVLELLPTPCLAIFPPPENCYSFGRSKSARAVIRDNDEAVNQRPRVAIVAPASGDEFVNPRQVVIRAQASDEDGFVEELMFYAGSRLLGAKKGADNAALGEVQAFEFDWIGASPGKHELTVVARDNQGRLVRSAPVSIVVLETLVPRTIVGIEAIDAIASESAPTGQGPTDQGVFRVTRRGDLNVPVEVSYRIVGTATNGRDYLRLGRSFTFEPGEASVDLVIEPLDDDLIEGTETVEIALVRPPCIAVFPPPPECYELAENAVALVRIEDDDRSRNLTPRVAIVQPRTRSVFHQPANIDVRVEAVDRDGWIGHVALFREDVLVTEQTLNFFREPDPGMQQRFSLVWEDAPIGEHDLVAVVTDDRGTQARSRSVKIAVRADGDLPSVTIAARDAFASEGTERRPVNQASFRIARTGATDEPLMVRYSISGTAENGADYETLPGTFMIPAKRRWAALSVIPINDDEIERAETVVVTLIDAATVSENQRYLIGRSARAGVVINNGVSVAPASQRFEDGTIHICIPAPNGAAFRIEVGTILGEWDVVGTNTVTEDAIHIVDTETEGTAFRFFRIIPDVDTESED